MTQCPFGDVMATPRSDRVPSVPFMTLWRRYQWMQALSITNTVKSDGKALLPAPDLPPGVKITNAKGVAGVQMAEHALLI